MMLSSGLRRRSCTTLQPRTRACLHSGFLACALPPLLVAAAIVPGPALGASPRTDLPPATLYVSPAGNAAWSGALPEPNAAGTDGPLPTPQAARDRIRQKRAAGEWTAQPVAIALTAGIHRLGEPLVLAPEDSGSESAPVTYTSATNERPIISGGRQITGWRPVEIDGKPLWAAQVPQTDGKPWYFRQLVVNGERRPRTRLPKEGFYRFAGLPDVTDNTQWGQGQNRAAFEPGHIRNWKNIGDVEITALHFWIESHLPLAEVDESANLVKFTCNSTFRLTEAHNLKEFARYHIENVFEALDTPGQWYLDRPTATLYYMPKPGETPENTVVMAPHLAQLVRVAGDDQAGKPVTHITFDNLSFQHTDWAFPSDKAGSVQAACDVPAAIHFQNADTCSVINSAVSHVSTYAIEIAKGCRNIRIDNCELTNLGAGGVKMGPGSSHSTVNNCEIGPGGLVFHSAIGVWVGSSGDNTVTHNHIHHFYYTGISVGWSWGYKDSPAVRNIIEYNHIHHIGQGWLSDMGGIYTLGVSPNTRLRYNLIHDIDAHAYGGWGLYNDEGSTHILLENNIVYNTKHAGYHQHYGKENYIRNNIFAFGRLAQLQRSRPEEHTSFIFERNIVYFSEPKLLDSTWKDDKFTTDYNLYWRTGGQSFDFAGSSFDDWRKRGHDTHSTIADPLFVDPEHGDFTLKPGSPAEKIGFKPINTAKIGRLKPAR